MCSEGKYFHLIKIAKYIFQDILQCLNNLTLPSAKFSAIIAQKFPIESFTEKSNGRRCAESNLKCFVKNKKPPKINSL